VHDLIFGLTVGGVVALVTVLFGTATAMYCKRVERSERLARDDKGNAA
jgi:hypothetical protein